METKRVSMVQDRDVVGFGLLIVGESPTLPANVADDLIRQNVAKPYVQPKKVVDAKLEDS